MAAPLRRDDRFDYATVLDFCITHGAARPHVIDLPYRLTSYSLEQPRNFAGWVDGQGRLQAVAVMQEPFAELDYALLPAADEAATLAAVLRWAAGRGQAIANAAHLPFVFYVWETPDNAGALRALAPLYAPHPRTMLLARRDLTGPPPAAPTLPPGYRWHQLDGADDAAYVALQRAGFGTQKMTLGWRQRMTQTPEYVAELNLAVVDAQGELAAAALGWVSRDGTAAQIEPGMTHPRHQRQGLMAQVVQALLGRLAARGVRQAQISWIGSNTPVTALLRARGFEVVSRYQAFACRRSPRTVRGLVRALRGRLRD